MKTKAEIQYQLDLFRREYQGKDPAILGITAAVQRGYLYGPNSNHKQIRAYWADLLRRYGEKYTLKSSPADLRDSFMRDIADIKTQMNNQFPNSFSNTKTDYDNEFRLAHAQKSLSIYLKHLWSRNLLGGNLPPVCPIDGLILKSIGILDPWTIINTFDNEAPGYNYYLQRIEIAAKQTNDPMAVWELFQWPSQVKKSTSPKNTTQKRKKQKPSKAKTRMASTIVSRNQETFITPIVHGAHIFDRTCRIVCGNKISRAGQDVYVFVGEDSKKSLCEVISSNGQYSDHQRDMILSHDGFEYIPQETKKPYFICKFSLSDVNAAKRLMEALTRELQ